MGIMSLILSIFTVVMVIIISYAVFALEATDTMPTIPMTKLEAKTFELKSRISDAKIEITLSNNRGEINDTRIHAGGVS